MTKQVQVTQKTQVEKLLRRGRLVTSALLKELGITKPSARICELRDDGLNIVNTKNREGSFAWKLVKSQAFAPAFA
jgi:hypothetical protein